MAREHGPQRLAAPREAECAKQTVDKRHSHHRASLYAVRFVTIV